MVRPINPASLSLWDYASASHDMGIGTTGKFETDAHRAIRNILQRGIDEEAAAKIGARKYERNNARRAYRKGSYKRYLTTTFGRSELKVPRIRGKIDLEFKLFKKYQRSQKKFDEMLVMSLILGLSTRKQKK